MQWLVSYLTMEVYLCILLSIGAYCQNLDHIEIPVNSAGSVENTPDILDLNTASGINTNSYYGAVGGPNYDVNSYGNRYSGRYFGKEVEELLSDRRLSIPEKFGRSGGVYEHYRVDDGNPDIHGRIERPCQAYDTFCIRKFFAEHSHCKISGRRLPDPFRRAQSTLNYPSANMSVTVVDTLYGGLNDARVAEFYINKATDNLVIAFSFNAISLKSNNTNAKFYLRGREPEVNNDFGEVIFIQITITLIIPGLDKLRLDTAEIYTYAENPLLQYVAGPRLGLSSDPRVVAMFLYFGTVGVPVEHLEDLSTEGVFYGANYLQYNICDFGLKVL